MTRIPLLLVLALAAGCLGAADPSEKIEAPVADPWDFTNASFLEIDHDHDDPTLHDAAYNLTLLHHLSIEGGTYGEFDAVGDLGVVAIIGPPAGLLLLSLADPDRPEILARFTIDGTIGWDAKLSPDGRYAFLGVANHFPFYPDAAPVASRNPAAAATGPSQDGIFMFDTTDRGDLEPLAHYRIPESGVHMLVPYIVDGQLYVYSANPIYAFEGLLLNAAGGIDIAVWDPILGNLRHVATYQVPTGPQEKVGLAPHDMMVYEDPVEGPLLILSFGGTNLASLRDPAAPEFITHVEGAPGHSARIFWVDGHRVLVADTEPFSGERQGPVHLYDAQDLRNVKEIIRWSIPGEDRPYDCCYRFAAHNFEIADGKLFIAHYHAGVWVVDVSTWENVQKAPTLGYYAPHASRGVPDMSGDDHVPNVWDVFPWNGRVFATDISTGVYELKPAE